MSLINNTDEDVIDISGGQEPTVASQEEPSEITDQVVEEVVAEPQAEPVAKPTPDPSSLTPPTQEPAPTEPVVEPTVGTVPQMNDEAVMKYLSEKQGKEITSLEDILKEPEPVVNPLEQDPQLKEIYEWRQRTGRPVTDWIKFQKDYDGMSNIEVARESLQYQYPDLTPDEIQLELSNYLPKEDDLEEEKALKSLNLKKIAADGRRQLNTLKSQFDTSVQTPSQLPEDVQQKVQAYDDYQKQVAQSKALQDQYNAGVAAQAQAQSSIPLTLAEDLSIDFTIPQESKNSLTEYMQMKHWFKEDGTYDHEAVVRDSYFIQNKDAIIKLAFEQGKAKGIEDFDKDSRNITLDKTPRQTLNNTDTGEKIIVEGAENFNGSMGTKIRFGKK